MRVRVRVCPSQLLHCEKLLCCGAEFKPLQTAHKRTAGSSKNQKDKNAVVGILAHHKTARSMQR